MEANFGFDVGALLSPEEAEKIFEEKPQESQEEEPAKEIDNTENTNPTEKEEPSEEVGTEESEAENDAVEHKGDGSSPTKFYSSIANALKNDGILPDFTDEEIKAVDTPEDFAELFEKALQQKFDERTRRIDEALGNGVEPDTIRMYEQTLQYLSGITDDAVSQEGDEGEGLRKQLIYNDLINRGYSQERANREIEKSFKAGSDIDDAKDALAELKKYYTAGYDKVRDEAKTRAEAARKEQQQNAEKFRKMVLEDEVKLGDTVLDKRTKQKVFDAVYKPTYKDPDSGQLLTEVQKFQKENPLEFLKQIGMWFVLTNGGKNPAGLVKDQVRAEKNKGIRELERKINTSALDTDGSLRYASGSTIETDSLLSDGWQIAKNF